MIKMDLIHDTSCPWCLIGKQRLKLALAQWDGDEVEVHESKDLNHLSDGQRRPG